MKNCSGRAQTWSQTKNTVMCLLHSVLWLFLLLLPGLFLLPLHPCPAPPPPPPPPPSWAVPPSPPSLPSSVPSSSSLAGARLIPPLLREQSWSVHPHQAFLLFCLALGPRDVSVEWHINGQKLETPVTEYRHVVSHDAVLVSSWLREEALNKGVQYECTAVSAAGSHASRVELRLDSRDEAVERWRTALTEHNTLLQQWKKAWESCDGEGVL
ncbi:uncharacterized protein LOC107653346 [Sinocyclocheilus anshuiensis]|uniref:uncharacterized protein LOC107653346 n=1 Tax=Sinocyclocheilus anshuiensis TaxID=1608454 RepID=UPI0007B8A476|nr:PREDICTED: uncharacterized protein LOC107653346 [Sinocyclocheilus anshuiensis]